MAKKKIFCGADAIVSILEDLGVRCVFGLPGTQNVALFEALRSSGIRIVLTSSETAAGFMANGWFRASGQPGVFLGIAGPGFAWAVAPLAEAALDSAAVVMITPKPLDRGYQHDLQAIPQDSIAESLNCSAVTIEDETGLQSGMLEAWSAATADGPRPVVLHIDASVADSDEVESPDVPIPAPKKRSDPDIIPNDLFQQFLRAERPVVIAGAGTLDFSQPLKQLVENMGAALVTTPTARGVVREDHPLCLRVDLLSDSVGLLNEFLESADLIVSLGCRFSHNGTGGFQMQIDEAKHAHVDLDSQVLNGNYRSRWSIHADVGEFLEQILARLEDSPPARSPSRQHAASEEFRGRQALTRRSVSCEPVWAGHGDCRHLFGEIRRGLSDDAILVTDTGLHQILARTYFDVLSPRGLIVPTDFQSMGFGVPAAIGAALAVPDRPVAALVGDGGLLMIGGEIATASRESVALPILVFRDGFLGQIRMQQLENFGYESATVLQAYDLESFARSLGADYVLAGSNLAERLKSAHKEQRPTVIEVQLSDDESLAEMTRRVKRKGSLKSALGPGVLKLLRRLR